MSRTVRPPACPPAISAATVSMRCSLSVWSLSASRSTAGRLGDIPAERNEGRDGGEQGGIPHEYDGGDPLRQRVRERPGPAQRRAGGERQPARRVAAEQL